MRDAPSAMLGDSQFYLNQIGPIRGGQLGAGAAQYDPSAQTFEKNFTRMAFMEDTMVKESLIIQRQTVMHEMLHAVDFQTGASSDKALIEAFKKDVNAQTIQKITKDGYAPYADDPREAFAEAGSRLIQPLDEDDAGDAADFRADFSNTLAYMAMLMTRVGVLGAGGVPNSPARPPPEPPPPDMRDPNVLSGAVDPVTGGRVSGGMIPGRPGVGPDIPLVPRF
jgi:hypothetical protein